MKFAKVIIILILIFLNIIFYWIFTNSQKENFSQITILDVGQGSGTLIQSKNGKNILIDTGNEKISQTSLFKKLGFFDRDLDIIFATHYDMDHIGLLPFYIKNYNVKSFIDTGVTNIGDSQKPLYDEIFRLLEQKNILHKTVKTGDIIKISPEISIKIFFPGKFLDLNKLKSNSGSMVLQVNISGKKILITGDLPAKFEKVLVRRYGKSLQSDILVAGHHGSKTSSAEEFLRVVAPKYFVISVSKNNSYGHPTPEVLNRAKKLGLKILRTDKLGSISFKIIENKLEML